MVLEISLVIVSLLFITSCYVMWNLMNKVESLEDWVTDFTNTIEKMQNDLKQMDYRGSFEADDETGIIFKQIQTTINQLDRFKGEEQ